MKLIKEVGDKFINLYSNWTNADEIWENRPYDFYLIFGQNDEEKSPWIKDNWKSDFEPYFELLINQSEFLKETGIRATNYKLDSQNFAINTERKRPTKLENQNLYKKIRLGN